MAATVEFYEEVLSAFPDTESLTVLVVAGETTEVVLTALGADLSSPLEDPWDGDASTTAWAAVEVPGGVLAVEGTGYGDPSLAVLTALSKAGAAAVVRGNIQGHYRFGGAREGDLVFDDDEFIYVDDPSRVPAELRPLFDAARVDLESDDEEERADPFSTGLAMADLVTGLALTAQQVAAVLAAESFAAPALQYPDGETADAQPVPPPKVHLEPGVKKFDTGQVWTGEGVYLLISSWDYSFEQEEPHDRTSDDFGLTIGEHSAWVRSLTRHATTQVSLTVLSSPTQPTATLESLRAAYTDEASGVVVARKGGLQAIGEHGSRFTPLTDVEGTFVLHVFGRLGQAAQEEHVLLLWPATND